LAARFGAWLNRKPAKSAAGITRLAEPAHFGPAERLAFGQSLSDV